MFVFLKNHLISLYIILFIITASCQLQAPSNNHGILFLENRTKTIAINESNQNDIIKILGQPHSRSIDNEDIWIYVERSLSKGKYHKLGRHTIKTNNVLVLSFNKYGVLKQKDLYNKNDLKKISFSDKKTANALTRSSFVEDFLSSVKSKMYKNRK